MVSIKQTNISIEAIEHSLLYVYSLCWRHFKDPFDEIELNVLCSAAVLTNTEAPTDNS